MGTFDRVGGDDDLREILLYAWHAKRGRVLHPAFGRISDDEDLPHLACLVWQGVLGKLSYKSDGSTH